MAVARTSGSGGTSGGPSITIRGWLSRTSRAGPQAGASSCHSGRTAPAGPTIDEHCRPCRRARSANTSIAWGVHSTGTRFAPAQHMLRSVPPSYQPQNSPPAPRERAAWSRDATKRFATRSREHSSSASSRSCRPRRRTDERSTTASLPTPPPSREGTRPRRSEITRPGTTVDQDDGQLDRDDRGSLDCPVLAHLLGDPHRLLDERLDDLRLRHGLDDLAPDEDLALAVAGGDAEVGLARLARAR